ncbi:MAG: hypothetical protein OXN17_00270 [Candidatus Poribacteria bacterium]|nr:hypothetical protein [Candidatus Poribacteria bacterium]
MRKRSRSLTYVAAEDFVDVGQSREKPTIKCGMRQTADEFFQTESGVPGIQTYTVRF